ncbi:hypothetical protein DID88_008390 [Monilinia fructigena]|uniref:Mannosyl phosphorylinositol ceramide synthase SUR1 n=1 Tax=Monilinia fructigena TaxID=38457 RepID=A0A395J5N6_9HELO|nr:hypothetical protein DID88_008390 [Monilinia fructigena]
MPSAPSSHSSFVDGHADAIHRSEIPAPGSELIENRTQLIPKIIHQTYINSSIPERWKKGQQSCVDLHEDYEYKLWTDEASREFIATEYPWFLDTFDSYPFPIQRADSIRYFVLAHYGGIYIDLDDGCNRRLDPLLSYPAWLRRTIPTGISNDAMGSVPQHPFFLRVIESLQSYNRNWGMPYITVMYSTGPLFLSVLWIEYMRTVTDEAGRVRNLMPDEYSKHSWSFFNVVKGNSWHGKDAQTIFLDGQALDVSHRSRIRHCRSSGRLSMACVEHVGSEVGQIPTQGYGTLEESQRKGSL